MEKQPVGTCFECGKMVYCDGGFLGGVVLPDHTIKCYECDTQDAYFDERNNSNK